jgi:hypothetical protein
MAELAMVASPLWWMTSFLRCHALQSRSRTLDLVVYSRGSSRSWSQSRPVNLNVFSEGRSQYFRISSRRALAFVHATVAWKASSESRPQMAQMQFSSRVLLHLFFFVGSESVATLQPKTCTLGGTLAFQMVSQSRRSP